MPMTESQKESIDRYKREKCDRIIADIPKGKKARYQAAAQSLGLSFSMLMQNSIEEYVQNHAGKIIVPELTFDEKKLLNIFRVMTPSAQKKLLNFLAES